MTKFRSIISVIVMCGMMWLTVQVTIVWLEYKAFSRPPSNSVPVPAAQAEPGHTFEDLLDAIEWVESEGDPNAVGDDGNAVGAYQIHKIYVDDVNRIRLLDVGGEKKLWIRYDYDDRTSRLLSRDMVRTYLKYYGGTFEEMARKHNGGPQGHKKESTKPYWTKVQARLMAKETK